MSLYVVQKIIPWSYFERNVHGHNIVCNFVSTNWPQLVPRMLINYSQIGRMLLHISLADSTLAQWVNFVFSDTESFGQAIIFTDRSKLSGSASYIAEFVRFEETSEVSSEAPFGMMVTLEVHLQYFPRFLWCLPLTTYTLEILWFKLNKH